MTEEDLIEIGMTRDEWNKTLWNDKEYMEKWARQIDQDKL